MSAMVMSQIHQECHHAQGASLAQSQVCYVYVILKSSGMYDLLNSHNVFLDINWYFKFLTDVFSYLIYELFYHITIQ